MRRRPQEALQSTVAEARISSLLFEDYRAPLNAKLNGEPLRLHHALVAGVGTILSTAGIVLGILLEYGLPLLFWCAPLFFPGRRVWRPFPTNPPECGTRIS
jgi:hypothetical protein